MAIPEHKSKWKTVGLDESGCSTKIRFKIIAYTSRRKPLSRVQYRVYDYNGTVRSGEIECLPKNVSEHDAIEAIINDAVYWMKNEYVDRVNDMKMLLYANGHDMDDPSVIEELEDNYYGIIRSMDIGEKIDDE